MTVWRHPGVREEPTKGVVRGKPRAVRPGAAGDQEVIPGVRFRDR